MTLTIYHNPRCENHGSLQYLEDNGCNPKIVDCKKYVYPRRHSRVLDQLNYTAEDWLKTKLSGKLNLNKSWTEKQLVLL